MYPSQWSRTRTTVAYNLLSVRLTLGIGMILVQRAAESSNLVKSERVTWPLTRPEDVCTVPSVVAGCEVYSPGRLQPGLSTGTELRGEENYERQFSVLVILDRRKAGCIAAAVYTPLTPSPPTQLLHLNTAIFNSSKPSIYLSN